MGGNVLVQQIPGMLVAIFIMHYDSHSCFLLKARIHQLMYGPKLILFPLERSLGQAGGLFLGRSHVVTHSQTCQPP